MSPERAGVDSSRRWLECDVPEIMPVLPLRSTLLFPLQVASVQVARRQSLALLEDTPGDDALVVAGALVDPEGGYARRNLGRVGLACRILSRLKMADGSMQVVLQGLRRVRIVDLLSSRPYFRARVACVEPESGEARSEVRRRVRTVLGLVADLVEADPKYSDELVEVLRLNRGDGAHLADLVADVVPFGYDAKREVLETTTDVERLDVVERLLRQELARSLVSAEVEGKTQISIERSQREALLREQLRVIRRELGELDPAEAEISALERRAGELGLPDSARDHALREIQQLRLSSTPALELPRIASFLDWLYELPWSEPESPQIDLRRVRRTLEQRHVGLADAKKRILEFLAVKRLGGSPRKSVLGIVGPPGTGKTTLGWSVAKALGRSGAVVSVAGVASEEGLRGQARGFVDAQPGRILDAVRRAGASDAVVVIEDVDRLEYTHGDPSAVLLDAFHPERSRRFRDHYLGVPFDLSQVLFIVTASLDDYIPDALYEFMDVVELTGYSEAEKIEIARRHVWPRAVEHHGLKGRGVSVTEAGLKRLIRRYTHESGVRELTLRVEQICRRLAARVASRGRERTAVGARNLERFAGAPVYPERTARVPQIGVATGLAWTSIGGDLLPIEALKMRGEGRLTLTGLLGEVMQESVAAAKSCVRARAESLEIDAEAFTSHDLHVHFPEGAIPKDGPSAGIAVATVLASLFSNRPIRSDLAMTGEISLRGHVLPVGGIRQKVLAADREGIRHLVLPAANERDVGEVPREVRQRVKFHLVTDVAEVFELALRAPQKERVSAPPPPRRRRASPRRVKKG